MTLETTLTSKHGMVYAAAKSYTTGIWKPLTVVIHVIFSGVQKRKLVRKKRLRKFLGLSSAPH
jgi:hypothetical protein